MFKVTITDLDNNTVLFEETFKQEDLDMKISRPAFICRRDSFSRPEKMISSYRTHLTLSGVSLDQKLLEELEEARRSYRIVTESE
jgi:hypothetical protein